MRHILLELYCIAEDSSIDCSCARNQTQPGLHCIFWNGSQLRCPNLLISPLEYEFAVSHTNGDIKRDAHICFGGEMASESNDNDCQLKDLWHSICVRHMNMAYDEFMKVGKVSND